MTHTLSRGLLAGAAGTAVLNAVTYADMALRGRDPSELPGRTVELLSEMLDQPIPGSGQERSNRVTALGALAGTASGLAVGVAAASARSAGVRLPAALEALAIGAGAMAATDGPTALLGLTEPRTWTAQDWISDAVPHLGYGIAAAAVLRATEDRQKKVEPAGARLVVRSLLLGMAAGGRSSLGVAAPVLRSEESRFRKLAVLATVGAELAADKLPITPARTKPQGFAPRFATAVIGAGALARRSNSNIVLPALAASAGAALGAYGGLAWRDWAAPRMPDWQAALIEDAATAGDRSAGLGSARGGAAGHPLSSLPWDGSR